MKLLVCIFGTQQKVRRASFVVATTAGLAVLVLGAPLISLFLAIFSGGVLVALTHDWLRRHPGES
jgi:hypothetical protein